MLMNLWQLFNLSHKSNIMKKGIFLAVFILSFLQYLYSQQISSFSPEPEKYSDELKTFMGSVLSEREQVIMGNYTAAWDSGLISPEAKNKIIILSNKLLKKNARPKPHFMLFILNQEAFLKDSLDRKGYNAWIEGLDFLADARNKQVTDIENYLDNTNNLIRNNIVFQSSSVKWKASQPDFYFEFKDSARVIFKPVTLTCIAVRDSIQIFNTSGVYAPYSQTWSGKGGRVTWERSGYNGNEVYSDLGRYSINMRLSEYTADSVTFYNKVYLNFSMLGKLEDKVEPIGSAEKSDYPRFESYQSDYRIINIYKNVNYQGGLAMLGSKLVGSGTRIKKARLQFFKSDSLKMVAFSEYFAFQPGRLTGIGTQVTIPIGKDSIYHPYLGMTYTSRDNIISLNRTEDFQSQSPFYNNYHKVEMNFDQLRWNLDDNYILFKGKEGAASSLANFQSDNLFDAGAYVHLQGIDQSNPLVLLRKYSEVAFSISFRGVDFARFIRTQHNQVQQMLKRLSTLGFLIYDINSDMVTLRQKLYDWVYASVDYIDYDVITLASETQAPLENARLDLTTYDLTINGVSLIRLSNAQNVGIYPRFNKITLKRNRSFQFDGVIDAGLFNFHGEKFFFNYDSFRLDLQDIDSLSLKVKSEDLDAYGRATLMKITSIIENMTGELLIDKPDNKSGRKDYAQYPIFSSRENSFVYYDDKEIQNGVYNKDHFYFEIYPFRFDSLDNFSKTGLKLTGRLVSAGIFPDFEETLLIQEDQSLGFRHLTNSEGLELYGGKGKYFETINMSNKGLIGTGKFEYLSSWGRSQNMMFHPDSMFGTLTTFEIQRQLAGIQYPQVTSTQNKFVFYPYLDEFLVSKGTGPFKILNDSTLLDGDLLLTSKGLSGSGKMELTNSTLLSDKFDYQAFSFSSDTADFRLKSLNTDGFTLVTDNVNAHVDFESRTGLFQTNEDFSLVEFPENKYISRLDLFVWNMDKTELEMKTRSGTEGPPKVYQTINGEEELAGPKYISVDKEQDSLSFVSTQAVYDYKRNIIRASYVTFLKVADAYIYPKNGEINVKPDGYIAKLEDANILVNRQSKLHSIYGAAVDIFGRFRYTGTGYYDYVDETGGKQSIFFDDIRVGDSVRTIASGMIPENQNFTLSPYYGFQGKATLFAENPFMTFNGGAKLFHACESLSINYIKFETEINPAEIYIPVPAKPLDINMNYLYSGIFITGDSSHIYSTFFNPRKLPTDKFIVTTDGFLYYDKKAEEYRISSKEKLADPRLPGNWLSLNPNTCIEYGEGDIDLGIRLGQAVISTFGDVRHEVLTEKTTLGTMISMDFLMSDEALKVMSHDIDSLQGLEAFDLTDEKYNKRISDIVGKERNEILQAELGLYGKYQNIPKELIHTLFFTKVDLFWNQDTRSYRSTGKIGIGSINGQQVHKMVDGYMELSKRRSGDLFDVYLQLDRNIWYYFGYTRGVMHVLSSNRNFNLIVSDLKTKQRQLKTKRNEEPYIFIVTTGRKKDMFLRGFLEGEVVNPE
jgi:hypothetical protein